MSASSSAQILESRKNTVSWFRVSLATAILVRLVMWLIYNPVQYSDTASYRRLAESVLDGFAHYDGTRTPGYPVFLALFGSDPMVWAVQMVMGVLVSLVMFYLGWRLSGRGWFGALLALVHTINLGQLFFEANLLTETLTTFTLAASLIGVYLLLQKPHRRNLWLCGGIGLTVSLTLLTRPLFVYLPFWVFLFIAFAYPPSILKNSSDAWKRRVWSTIGYSIPVVILVGGWILFIHQRYGEWGLTTMTGYHLVQHTGSYFEYVPDEYAALRDTFIQYRDAKIAATGTQTNAIWEAIPEMSRVSGLNFYDLSRTLAHISINLIREHPGLFLKNVAQGWWMFWRAPMYWTPDALQIPSLAGIIRTFVFIQRALLIGVNAIFVPGSIAWLLLSYLPFQWSNRAPLLIRRLREIFHPAKGIDGHLLTNHYFMLFVAGNIWITSILQSLLDHGDNPRFLLPLQSFVVLWVAWFILQIKSNWNRSQ